jgi:hypothetical protein
MSMAGSDPQAEKLSEQAQRAFEAKNYLKSVEYYSAAAQLAPTCAAPLPVKVSRCAATIVRAAPMSLNQRLP